MSYDTPDDNKKFADKFKFNFDLLSDTDKSVAKNYGAFDPASPDYAKRSAFVIGKDGKVLNAWEKVKAAEFPGEVLAILAKESAAP